MTKKQLKPRLINITLSEYETNALLEHMRATLEHEIELTEPCYSYIKTMAGIAEKIDDAKQGEGW